MTKDYSGFTHDRLAVHANEGWDLANKRTEQLREAVEALRGAAYVVECWSKVLRQDAAQNPNLKDMTLVLEWAEHMFPEEGESIHDLL